MSSAPKLRIARLSAEVVDQALRLSYEVVNDSDLELGLLDRVPVATDVTQPPGFAPENAYLGAFDATLVVRKAILPLPPGLRASERVVPGITRLGPRASRSEDIALPLPVRAHDPHRQAQMRLGTPGAIDVVATLSRRASRVRLIIGYFEIGSARLVPLSRTTRTCPGRCPRSRRSRPTAKSRQRRRQRRNSRRSNTRRCWSRSRPVIPRAGIRGSRTEPDDEKEIHHV